MKRQDMTLARPTTHVIANEAALAQLCQTWAATWQFPKVVYLLGELGAGKTTLVRHFLRALGYDGIVKSPTYGIIEAYPIGDQWLQHLDCYRLESAVELAALGVTETLASAAWVFVEWPEQVQVALPKPDWVVHLTVKADASRTLQLMPGAEWPT